MQKINFQNLPNTTTPLNATNLNALQDNVEDVFDGDVPMGDIETSSVTSTGNITALNQANFGAYNDTQVSGWNDAIFTRKSFIGSIQVSGTWYILINIRHRNGNDDGTNYGIQIMTPMTSTDIVQIRNQIGGTWGNWRTL